MAGSNQIRSAKGGVRLFVVEGGRPRRHLVASVPRRPASPHLIAALRLAARILREGARPPMLH
jgi:hypothetical protein